MKTGARLLHTGIILPATFLLYSITGYAQIMRSDTTASAYAKIYAYALDANIRPAMQLVAAFHAPLSDRDSTFKATFEARFLYPHDRSRYPAQSSAIDSLVAIYKDYWRKSMLDTAANYDTLLSERVTAYLIAHYPAGGLTGKPSDEAVDDCLKRYIQSQHLYTTGFGKTGRLTDLLVWRTQRDTIYRFKLAGDTTMEPVTFMENFVTLGWEEYATMGRLYPGGWTTTQSLYCVAQAYDLQSETFLVSYLAHESRHYKDYTLFPKLGSADLEYRAKLMELSLAQTSLFELLAFFIANANEQSNSGHSVANYCVIRDLSHRLFNKPFEADMRAWKKAGADAVNKTAAGILRDNTSLLKKEGTGVTQYIRMHPVK
jgi:hypothetical protein